MSVIGDAATALETALKTVPGLKVSRIGTTSPQPPAAIIGPPQITWDAFCTDPTNARFTVFLVVPWSDRSLDQLWELLTPVHTAIEDVSDAVAQPANPTVFNAGGSDLPAYEIVTEVAL